MRMKSIGLLAAGAFALGAVAAPGAARAQDAAQLMQKHQGGTLRLVSNASEGTIDPQINYAVAVLAGVLRRL